MGGAGDVGEGGMRSRRGKGRNAGGMHCVLIVAL